MLLSPCLAEQPRPGALAADTLVLAFNSAKAAACGKSGKLADAEIERQIREVLLPSFDFSELAHRSVGGAWQSASPAERSELSTLLGNTLARSFIGMVRSLIPNWSISVLEQTEKGRRARVRTLMTSAQSTAKADFTLIRERDAWRIHNVVVENFSLEKLYQVQFAGIVEKEGINGLIARLRAKV